MQGRVCIVTGGSSGIGQATALGLARMGATIVLVCRNRERAEAARTAIRAATGNNAVAVVLADLSSQAEIRQLARDLLARYPQMHVLVNNAGVFNRKRSTTVDGIETVFAVNHLAYFLLTHLLLECLIASGSARIVNVASHAHRWGRLDFDDLQNERTYHAMQVYGQSKLCNILFTRELARRIAGTGVTVNCLHPGGVATGLGWNNGWWAVLIAKALRPFLRTPEQGADTAVYLATSPEVEAVNGKYFCDRRAVQLSPTA
ncbi:MAG: SDR family oxidoreductase, partial [Deltaproteobacteria bacterium]|nr:SDR family oxidoreductase [Deltaproteobacteria bacterium]